MNNALAHLVIWHWDNTSTVLHLDETTTWRTDPNDGIIYKTDGHAASRSIWPWSSIKSYEISVDSEAEQDEDNTENIGTALHEMFENMAGGDVAMFRYDPATGKRTPVDPEEALNLASLITNTMTDTQQHQQRLKHELECAIKEFGNLEDYQQTFRDFADAYGQGVADHWREVFLAQNGDIVKANDAVMGILDARREKREYVRKQEQEQERQARVKAYREAKEKADRGETTPRTMDVNAAVLRSQGHKVETRHLPDQDVAGTPAPEDWNDPNKNDDPSVEEIKNLLDRDPWDRTPQEEGYSKSSEEANEE